MTIALPKESANANLETRGKQFELVE